MKIVADSNIPFAAEAFAQFGHVTSIPGREMSPENIDAALLDAASVRFVATATIGCDHVDRGYLADRTIGFASAPGSNADSVADYVVSALLHLSFVKNWPLAGKTLGIVGVGNVGSRVYRRALALGLKCIVCDPPKARLTGSDFYRPLEELLGQSDIVSLHVPLIAEGQDATLKMAGREFFAKMKPGALFVNTCRGKVMDERALRESRGRLTGVILDVWENEPIPDPETIRIADIATPHIAGHSYDGKVAGTRMIYNAACAFLFAERKWTGESAYASVEETVLSFPAGDPSLYDIVSKAYPIMDDDLHFRALLDVPPEKVAQFYDGLRVNYPRRMEFSHFRVDAPGMPEAMRIRVRELGFAMDEPGDGARLNPV